MAEGSPEKGVSAFSPRELALLKLVQQRLPGNRAEDDDRELGPRAASVAQGSMLHRIVYSPSLRADALRCAIQSLDTLIHCLSPPLTITKVCEIYCGGSGLPPQSRLV